MPVRPIRRSSRPVLATEARTVTLISNEDRIKYGAKEAYVLRYIEFWIIDNMGSARTGTKVGNTYTMRHSINDFSKHFPDYSISSLKRVLKRLITTKALQYFIIPGKGGKITAYALTPERRAVLMRRNDHEAAVLSLEYNTTRSV